MSPANRSYQDSVRATYTRAAPDRFHGVIKELGTDAWLWECSAQHRHPKAKVAIQCARSEIGQREAAGWRHPRVG